MNSSPIEPKKGPKSNQVHLMLPSMVRLDASTRSLTEKKQTMMDHPRRRVRAMFVLLQIYPPEASDEDDRCCCLDVIAVSPSQAELERYLAAYERRYRAACREFDAWDDMSMDWGEAHDRMLFELAEKHQVYGGLVMGARFEIVESRRPLVPARAA